MAGERREIIGTSKPLLDVLARAARVARTTVSVMIEGESGTGKELIARRVHETSERASGPFVAVNCAAIPKDLLESTLFGHERGAFSGAVASSAGAFERAHGGTLLLDEIGDMPIEQQAKVLRVLQEHEVQRVGAAAPRKIDVRIIAATHRTLRDARATSMLREDLYYRLAGYTLRLPPLRERGRDIVTIAKALLAREFPTKYFSRAARARLVAHVWPGNIRELENVVRAAAIDAPGRQIDDLVLVGEHDLAGITTSAAPPAQSINQRLDALHDVLRARGRITVGDVRTLFDLQKARATCLLAAWEVSGEIVRHGKGRATFYVAARRNAELRARLQVV